MTTRRIFVLVALCAGLAFLPAERAGAGGKSWFKGVTHIHSLWSDGDMSPDMIAKWYKDRDYHFICFSEHNLLQEGESYVSIVPDTKLSPERVDMIREAFGDDWVEISETADGPRMRLKTHDELRAKFDEPGRFLMIQAEEITTIGGPPHVNAINIQEPIRGRVGDPRYLLNLYLDEVHEQSKKYGMPMIAHVNHLNWSSGITTETMLTARRLKFFEVYNGHPGVRNYGSAQRVAPSFAEPEIVLAGSHHERALRDQRGMPSNERHWDVLLSLRMTEEPDFILYGISTDDSHEYYEWGANRSNAGRGWVRVRAESLEANALLDAMERGDFYGSTGVALDRIETDELGMRIHIAAEEGVTYTTQFIGTRQGFDREGVPYVNDAGETPDTASLVYSSEIGVVLHETQENPATYTFTGDEVYVRANVVSSKDQPNPLRTGDKEMAWVQPVRVYKP